MSKCLPNFRSRFSVDRARWRWAASTGCCRASAIPGANGAEGAAGAPRTTARAPEMVPMERHVAMEGPDAAGKRMDSE